MEFEQGSLPGAINLPIMDNDERTLVGTVYKKAGREEAVARGHQLVSGNVKELRLKMWMEQIRQHPKTVLYCFRGGLRSQITQSWLQEAGVERPLIEGGYKKARFFLRSEIERFSESSSLLMLTGPTGSAKTHVLNKAMSFCPALDLEAMAQHRGSAFGAGKTPQPSQADFENRLAVEILKLSEKKQGQKTLVEDESRMIGKCALPEALFLRMRVSDVIFLEESFEQRVENILQDYVVQAAIGQGIEGEALLLFERYRKATQAISKKLGGVRTQEVLQDLAVSEQRYLQSRDFESNRAWIAKLLSYYYDPLYAGSLEKRAPKVLMRGSSAAMLDYLRNLRAGC